MPSGDGIVSVSAFPRCTPFLLLIGGTDCCTLKKPPKKSLRSFVCCATKSVWYGHKPMLLPPAITRTQDTEAMALFTASAEAAMDNGEDEMAEFYAAAAAAVNEASL